jgi:Protein of unknown function (DUF3800)
MKYIPAEELWFLMHQSDAPGQAALSLTCYTDDSGSHENSQWVVVGSLLMHRALFLAFDVRWQDMLKDFNIDHLHMTDFVRPHGRFSSWYSEMKIALFAEATKLINQHKAYSLGVAIQQEDFKALFSMEVYKKLLGPYAFAFMTTMLFNCGVAQFHKSEKSIAYLGDKGTGNHHEQLDAAHSIISEWERRKGYSNVGAIAFDFDHRVSALQAADAIAWTLHRQRESEEFGKDFLPLLGLFEKQYGPTGKSVRPHHSMVVPKDEMSAFANTVKNWIDSTGKLPTLQEMMGIKTDGDSNEKI